MAFAGSCTPCTYLTEMDADFSHNLDDLPRLVESCRNGADVSIGSRYSKGVRRDQLAYWPCDHVWFASAFVRTVLNMPVYDCTAGFICYHRWVLESRFRMIRMKGYGFQISMKYYAYKLGSGWRKSPSFSWTGPKALPR